MNYFRKIFLSCPFWPTFLNWWDFWLVDSDEHWAANQKALTCKKVHQKGKKYDLTSFLKIPHFFLFKIFNVLYLFLNVHCKFVQIWQSNREIIQKHWAGAGWTWGWQSDRTYAECKPAQVRVLCWTLAHTVRRGFVITMYIRNANSNNKSRT